MTDAVEKHGDVSAKLWKFLLKSGGRWLSADVARGVQETSAFTGQMLASMARNGSVRQFPVEGVARRFAYGVTGACKVPRNVTVQEVAECVMAQPADEDAA